MTAILFQVVFTDGVRHFVSGSTSAAKACVCDFHGCGRRVVSIQLRIGAGPVHRECWPQRGRGMGARRMLKETYALRYFPPHDEIFADALPISVAPGEIGAANFRVSKQPVFRISGEVDVPGEGGVGRVTVGNDG